MSNYAALVLPIDAMRRTLNYDNRTEGINIKALISEKMGSEGLRYIDRFLAEANGGVVRTSRSVPEKLISLSKGAAVAASLSVAIQQPSAYIRAAALIDVKYLKRGLVMSKRGVYKDMREYAPGVTFAKEIGGFDVSVGGSAQRYINTTTLTKGKKFSYYSEKISDVTGWLPEQADRVTWMCLWNACYAEVSDKNPSLSGDELKKKVGWRFTEVVTYTQVYDSILSRSEIMRRKDAFSTIITSFMSEPTVTLNMLYDAAVNHGGWKFTRAVGTFIASTVFNAFLKSLVTAGRDDEENKTILEKFTGKFVGSLTDDLFLPNSIPVVRDIISVFSGYDVTRADMSLFSDLKKAVDSYKNNASADNLAQLVGSISSFAGIPVKNIYRDIRSVVNVFTKTAPISETDKQGLKYVFLENIGFVGDPYLSDYDDLNGAIEGGDKAEMQEVLSEIIDYKMWKNPDAVEADILKTIRSQVTQHFKPLYIAASPSERQEIENKLRRAGIYENAAKTVKSWLKE